MAHLLQTPKSDLTRFLIAALLVASIFFGFFKQVRTFIRSRADYSTVHTEPGIRAKGLRAELERKFFGVQITKMRLGYFADIKKRSRPAEEYLYDAQYGIAPYYFIPNDKKAEIIFSE
jgi:hypothetical protein